MEKKKPRTRSKPRVSKRFDVDALLAETVGEIGTNRLSADDHAFLLGLVSRAKMGARAVMVVLTADNALEYMIINDSRAGSLELLTRMMFRTVNDCRKEGSLK